MQGKTKGIFEDIFVLLVIVVLGWGGYTLFFTEKELISSTTTMAQSQPTKNFQEQINSPNNQVIKKTIQNQSINQNTNVKPEDLVEKNRETLEQTVEIVTQNTEENKKINYQNVTKDEIIEKIIKNDNKVSSPKVDIQVLQKFLIETKQKIKNSITVHSENNKGKENLSIRVTILKNGAFEQLIYTSGNKDIFKNNYENMVQVFPLIIDEKIVGEFPRYLRYSYEFSVKEE